MSRLERMRQAPGDSTGEGVPGVCGRCVVPQEDVALGFVGGGEGDVWRDADEYICAGLVGLGVRGAAGECVGIGAVGVGGGTEVWFRGYLSEQGAERG